LLNAALPPRCLRCGIIVVVRAAVSSGVGCR
jgi:hypothetical protein